MAPGDDKDLNGKALEKRTRLLFAQMGFDIRRGRCDLEDFVINPPSDAQTSYPIVLEVKSSTKSNIKIDDLRQLDDWVFDLSGEEEARKEGLGGGIDDLAMVSGGLASRKRRHANPHKGVMVFNGPVGMDFLDRKSGCLDKNKSRFTEKRNICVIPLDVLIGYANASEKDKAMRLLFWENIHGTAGMLNGPELA